MAKKNVEVNPDELVQCSRCKRVRRARFTIGRKNYSGRIVLRCRKASVCHSIAKRTNPDYRRSVEAHGKRAKS